ncbi:MAG: hypothetical protein ACJ709_04820 [Nitrososphaeraceae archaeon]
MLAFVILVLLWPAFTVVLFPIIILPSVVVKYYRFSRRRKNYLFGLSGYYKSKKKSDYMINIDRSKMLDSFYFENQVWGALHKAWKGYVIAKNKDEYDKMVHYADIQECQDDLGLPVSSFHDTGKSALAFHSACLAN